MNWLGMAAVLLAAAILSAPHVRPWLRDRRTPVLDEAAETVAWTPLRSGTPIYDQMVVEAEMANIDAEWVRLANGGWSR